MTNKKLHIYDLHVYEIYGSLLILNNTYDPSIKRTQSSFEKEFKNIIKFKTTINRNATIFFNNANAYNLRENKITDPELKKIIEERNIYEFYKWFYKKINLSYIVSETIDKLDNNFKTKDLQKKINQLDKGKTAYAFERPGTRDASTLASILTDFGFARKISNGNYEKVSESVEDAEEYIISIKGDQYIYRTKGDFNEALISYISGVIPNPVNYLQNFLSQTKKVRTFIANDTYDNKKQIDIEKRTDAIYEYLFTSATTREIDAKYAGPNNGMYINSTVNKLNLNRYDRKHLINMKISESEAKKVISEYINDTSNNGHDDQKKTESKYSDEINDLIIARGIKRPTSKRSQKTEEKIQEKRKESGSEAEEFIFNDFKKFIGKNVSEILKGANEEIITEVIDKFREDTNAGYDILVKTEKRDYKVEVKSIKSHGKGSFAISPNEIKNLNNENGYILLFKSESDIRTFRYQMLSRYFDMEATQYQVKLRIDNK